MGIGLYLFENIIVMCCQGLRLSFPSDVIGRGVRKIVISLAYPSSPPHGHSAQLFSDVFIFILG